LLSLGCWPRIGMEREPHRSLMGWCQRHGAGLACVARAVSTSGVQSGLCSSSSATLGRIARSAAVGVPSSGAGLRASLRRRARVGLRFAVQRGVAVRSVSSGLFAARLLRPASLPNNSFEPTLETPATSLRVGCGAAQLKRWASRS
jgi:hypothetical protein